MELYLKAKPLRETVPGPRHQVLREIEWNAKMKIKKYAFIILGVCESEWTKG